VQITAVDLAGEHSNRSRTAGGTMTTIGLTDTERLAELDLDQLR
jgi:hypothetical protein